MTIFTGWMGDFSQQGDEAIALLKTLTAQTAALDYTVTENTALAALSSAVEDLRGCQIVAANTGVAKVRMQRLLSSYLADGVTGLFNQPDITALVIVDQEHRCLILATDPIGLSSIYYAQTKQGVVFANNADAVVNHPDVNDTISAQTIYDYVYFHHCPSPNTIYQQVKKLEGGQYLLYENGQLTIKRYWLPKFSEQLAGSAQDAGRELQQQLIAAVKSMATDEEHTGAFLSGGLDSSSVAGALAKVFPGKAKTFSMGFPVEGYNEIEYANLAVKHFNTRQHEYYVTPQDTVDAVSKIASFYDEPFGNSSALAAYYCAKLAKDNGVTRLLAGDGGDEIFAGNERYAKQKVFEYYQQIPSFLSVGLEVCLNNLPAALAKQTLPYKAKRYIDQAKAAMPDRLQDYNFLHRHAAADIFDADFLSQIDTGEPLQLLRDTYHRPEQASSLNRMLYMDWKSTLHDNDLVKVNRMCELAGVEVCYPLLDQSIVDLSCRIPSNNKLPGQKLRWFYKQAMADFLPAQIINKPKHGFGLPFGIWLKDHQPLKELAYDAIHNLKKRAFFKPEFLDHAIEMHQSIHAEYYGELIWILMMLELWFAGRNQH